MNSLAHRLQQITEQEITNRTMRLKQMLFERKEGLAQLVAEYMEQAENLSTKMSEVEKQRGITLPKETAEQLRLFQIAVHNVLNVYFPILMDSSYVSLACQEQDVRLFRDLLKSVSQLSADIQKSWQSLFRQASRTRFGRTELKADHIEGRKNISKELNRKGKNCKIPPQSTYILEKWLLENFTDPYPSTSKKIDLARQSKLNLCQVNNWFINARERVVKRFNKKETLKMMRQEQS